jgi:hypothetical protein
MINWGDEATANKRKISGAALMTTVPARMINKPEKAKKTGAQLTIRRDRLESRSFSR